MSGIILPCFHFDFTSHKIKSFGVFLTLNKVNIKDKKNETTTWSMK